MLKRGDILYFLHIPKTGGTSLMAWLNLLFAPDRVCPHAHLPAVREELARDARRYDFIAGHFGLALLELLPSRPRLVTWLRDPARRLLSTFHFLRELPDDYVTKYLTDPRALCQREAALRLSFHEWVQLPQADYGIHNLEVRHLAGDDCEESQVLPRAIRTLARADHFGLTEQMQDSVDLLCHRLVLPPRRFELRLNQSEATRLPNLPRETLEIIRECSQPSYQMMDFARDIFTMRWQEMLQDLDLSPGPLPSTAEATAFMPLVDPTPSAMTNHPLLHQRLETRYRIQRAESAPICEHRFAMAEEIHGSGWLQAVQVASGRWVRWSGPEPVSVLYLNLPKQTMLEISWSALWVMDYEVVTSFRLRVNDMPVPLVFDKAPCDEFPHAFRFSGILTPSMLQREPGLVKLEFHIARTFPEPVASEPAQGPKLLGFCTDAVTFQPV